MDNSSCSLFFTINDKAEGTLSMIESWPSGGFRLFEFESRVLYPWTIISVHGYPSISWMASRAFMSSAFTSNQQSPAGFSRQQIGRSHASESTVVLLSNNRAFLQHPATRNTPQQPTLPACRFGFAPEPQHIAPLNEINRSRPTFCNRQPATSCFWK